MAVSVGLIEENAKGRGNVIIDQIQMIVNYKKNERKYLDWMVIFIQDYNYNMYHSFGVISIQPLYYYYQHLLVFSGGWDMDSLHFWNLPSKNPILAKNT